MAPPTTLSPSADCTSSPDSEDEIYAETAGGIIGAVNSALADTGRDVYIRWSANGSLHTPMTTSDGDTVVQAGAIGEAFYDGVSLGTKSKSDSLSSLASTAQTEPMASTFCKQLDGIVSDYGLVELHITHTVQATCSAGSTSEIASIAAGPNPQACWEL
ncbi:MAG: hypothetical protein ACI8PZ_005605 [Myxococcota bacterium]|jgi:hypothetical protein